MIPWRREWLSTPVFLPGGFHGQRSLAGFSMGSMGSQGAGHEWATNYTMRGNSTFSIFRNYFLKQLHHFTFPRTGYPQTFQFLHTLFNTCYYFIDCSQSTCNAGNPGSIPRSGRSAGEGIGYSFHYPWTFLVAQLVKNPPAMWETWVWSLGWEDPLEKGKATHSSILAWRIPWTV